MAHIYPLEVKSVNDGTGEFDGICSVYGSEDQGGDIVVQGAYAKTLREHGKQVTLLWSHKSHMPIGTADLTDSAKGLLVHGKLLTTIQAGREAYELLKAKVVKGLSIGYKAVIADFDAAGRRLLKEVRLFEVSLVANPMALDAEVTSVKSAEQERLAIGDCLDKMLDDLASFERSRKQRAIKKEEPRFQGRPFPLMFR